MSRKPRVFVGSSAESLSIAEAVLYNLDYAAEVTPWSAGLFDLSKSALRSLLDSLDSFDFAVFVFSPDDVIRIRGKDQRVPRDNVVFELGLFIGCLGAERCFIVVPRHTDDLRLPTDLAGFNPGTYEANRSDGNLKAALVYPCSDVKDAIASAGVRKSLDEERMQPEFEVQEPSEHDGAVVDQSCTQPHNLGASINEGFPYVAQVYTAAVTGRLTGVNVNIRSLRSMNPDQDRLEHPLWIAIYNVEGGFPGEPLTETILDTDEATIDDFVGFPSSVDQAAGRQYAIVAHYPSAPSHGAGQCVGVWSGSADGSYEGGDLCFSKDGLSWFVGSLGQHDVHFRTYVIPTRSAPSARTATPDTRR